MVTSCRCLALLALLALTRTADAQVIAYDPFNQAAGTPLIGTASSSVPWPTTSVWSQAFASTTGNSVLAPGLTFGPLLTEGNRAVAARIIGNPGPAGAARSGGERCRAV